MKNNVYTTPIFDKYYKKYSKKYSMLKEDVNELIAKLIANPKLGTYLGNNLYKIRISNSSSNKGKSGGFRVITYLLTNTEKGYDINLLVIYDKAEIANISASELMQIANTISD